MHSRIQLCPRCPNTISVIFIWILLPSVWLFLFCLYVDGIHDNVHADDGNIRNDSFPICVDLSQDDSVCSNDPVSALNVAYDKEFNMGVPQTIDGTDEEKHNIENILKLMNKYWNEEVLANFDYNDVKYTCKNRNKLCAFWASVNECESNRVFMLPNCALACRFCLLQATDLVPNTPGDAIL